MSNKKIINIDFESLIANSVEFQKLKKDLTTCTQQSLTGITNFVVNFEDTTLVNSFLTYCYENKQLYNETIYIDAVELQHGSPGKMRAYKYLDELIYGEVEAEEDKDLGILIPCVDPQTGKRKRKPNGFVNRKVTLTNNFHDKLLIIRNIDYSLDFCEESPGDISPKAVELFDSFRDNQIRRKCRLLLISNKKLNLPFQVRTVEISPVDEFCAEHILLSFQDLYSRNGYEINLSKAEKEQICRKISGLTYTEASDVLAHSLSYSVVDSKIETLKLLKNLRHVINKKFMEKGFGLQQLTARPWEDYICPENSNFTWDVKKLLRDFEEIKNLQNEVEKKIEDGEDDSELLETIEKIQSRIPHVMVLYGKGGIGKCLGKDTKVRMFDGSLKNVQDINVGDFLMGPDSLPRKVLRTNKGVGPLFEIKQKNGNNYTCNNFHILSLLKEGASCITPVFYSVEDFLKQNKTFKKTHYGWKAGVEYPEIKTTLDPYLLGLWLGDGSMHKPCITTQDEKVVDFLKKWALNNGMRIRKETKKNGHNKASSYHIVTEKGKRNKITSSLRKMGLLENKFIPKEFLINSRENRLKLLAGLIDSDGYRTSSNNLQFFNTNQKLSNDVVDLARSLGFQTFLSSSIKKLKSRNYSVRCYVVTIRGKCSEIPIKLERRVGKDHTQKPLSKCGISVESIGVGEYFGFTLDSDHQFLLEDYTVTHNSAMPIHLAGLLGFDVWDFNINSLHSKWIGESSDHARDSIKSIMSTSHVIIRVDEYDRAMGSTSNSSDGMHTAHKQVESEFMAWLQNGQEENEFVKKNIFVIMTTNHKENITGPMLRSGRVDLVIDIDNFDSKSMEETLLTTARRMSNRGIKVLGFNGEKDLQDAINSLDLQKISEMCAIKGFTVRDIETLIIEMASYKYYYDKGGEGLEWNTENFMKVLENSSGSMKDDDTTGELVLGDRDVLSQKSKQEDLQEVFDFDYGESKEKETLGFLELS